MLDIQEILKKVRLIEIRTRKAVNDVLAGQYHSAFKGQGVEFHDVRLYQPGDDYRSIDWMVTARTGQIHVKQFDEERQQTVLFAVDVSASLRFGTAGRLKSEVLAEAVALLAFSALRSQDRVGMILFSDRVEQFIPPRKGREHILRLVREVMYFQPKGRGTNFSVAFSAINHLAPRKATVFLCSDFMASLGRGLPVLARRHDVTALFVEDPAERTLPASGWVEWADPETGRHGWSHTSSAKLGHLFHETRLRQKQLLLQSLLRSGVPVVSMDTAGEVVTPLVAYFRSRGRPAA